MSFQRTGRFIQVEVDECICDFCGKPMSHDVGLDHAVVMHFNFGYLSTRDGEHWDWDACDKCIEQLLPAMHALRAKNKIPAPPPVHHYGAD